MNRDSYTLINTCQTTVCETGPIYISAASTNMRFFTMPSKSGTSACQSWTGPTNPVGSHVGLALDNDKSLHLISASAVPHCRSACHRKTWSVSNWTGKVVFRPRKKFLVVDKACLAIDWPTPGFKGTTFVSSGSSTEGYHVSSQVQKVHQPIAPKQRRPDR